MPDGIAVTPERLREISTQMSIGAVDVQEILRGLSAEVAPVRTEWVGSAQAQFNTLWDQLQGDASGLHSALTGIAKLTEQAARAYEAAEASIAKSFDEFRVERDLIHATTGVFDDVAELLAESTGKTENTDKAETTVKTVNTVKAVNPVKAVDTDKTESTVPTETAAPTGTTVSADSTVQTENTVPADSLVEVKSPETPKVRKIVPVPAEEVTPSVDRPRAGTRLPWARFMKTEDTETTKVVTDVRRRDRRFKASDPNLKPGTRLCRLCFTVVILEREYIETTDLHDNLRCPHCEGSFPIRHGDVESILQRETPVI